MTEHRACQRSSQRGFVIVAVLWILVALSSLALIFSAYLSVSAHALAVSDTALQTEALVSASVELTAYRLMLANEKKPSHGSFHFRMNDVNVNVAFLSEAARIDLNFASKDVLAALFAGLGASKSAAMDDADRIVGWRTRPVPGSANDEGAFYAAAGLGYAPRQSLFMHVNELALVAGLPPALVERALPFVTVFNGNPDVDMTIAAPEVVAALPDRNSRGQKDAFGEGPVPSNEALPGGNKAAAASRDGTTAKSPCYRIETTITFKSGRRTVSEVVIALGDSAEPYRVLSWQDDVEPRNNAPVRRRSR
jgi:general secretion pathway protein K